MKKKITKDVLIAEIRAYAEKLGYVPTVTDMRPERGVHCYEIYLRRFGSWAAVIEAAGLNTDSCHRMKAFRDGNEEQLLIREIRELAERLGRTPRIEEMMPQNQVHSSSHYVNYFGSWKNAVKSAGLDYVYGDHYTDQELLDALRKVCEKLSCIPSEKEYKAFQSQEKAFPSSFYYSKHFGSFDEALIVAGLKEALVEEQDDTDSGYFTKDEIIEILHEAARILNRPPLRATDIRRARPDDYQEIMSDIKLYFKHIRSALEEAGIGADAWPGMRNVFWE